MFESSTKIVFQQFFATARMLLGSAFQVEGPACEKARSLNFVHSNVVSGKEQSIDEVEDDQSPKHGLLALTDRLNRFHQIRRAATVLDGMHKEA